MGCRFIDEHIQPSMMCVTPIDALSITSQITNSLNKFVAKYSTHCCCLRYSLTAFFVDFCYFNNVFVTFCNKITTFPRIETILLEFFSYLYKRSCFCCYCQVLIQHYHLLIRFPLIQLYQKSVSGNIRKMKSKTHSLSCELLSFVLQTHQMTYSNCMCLDIMFVLRFYR